MGYHSVDFSNGNISALDSIVAAFTSEGILNSVVYRDAFDQRVILSLKNFSCLLIIDLGGGVNYGSGVTGPSFSVTNETMILNKNGTNSAISLIIGAHYVCVIYMDIVGRYTYGLLCKSSDLADLYGISFVTANWIALNSKNFVYSELTTLVATGIHTTDNLWYKFGLSFYSNFLPRQHYTASFKDIEFLTMPQKLKKTGFLKYGNDLLIPATWMSSAFRSSQIGSTVQLDYSVRLIGGAL